MDDVKQAYTCAMRLLAMREHARIELQRKLSRRGFSMSVITDVLNTLAQDDLQSDERYAESYVRMRSNRGYGEIAILRDLQQLQLTQATIEMAFSAANIDWQQLAAKVRIKKFGTALPVMPAERAKQQRFLQYRGFTNAQIRSAIANRVDSLYC